MAGISVLMGLTSRPLESCHHQCLKAVCVVLEYPKGAAAELLDGTLELRYCTTIFTSRFPPWSLPRAGNGGGKRQVVTPGHPSDTGSNMDKRVRLTRKTRPSASSHVNPDPGHPREFGTWRTSKFDNSGTASSIS